MTERDIGRVFLFACSWDWSIVGRVAGFEGIFVVLTEAGYFTRTGAVFPELCAKGFVADTQFHAMQNGARIRIGLSPDLKIFDWTAAWPQPSGGRRRG